MSDSQRDDAARQEEAAAVDAYVRHHLRVELDDTAHAPSSSEAGEPDEDQQFNAYMRQHFPGGLEE